MGQVVAPPATIAFLALGDPPLVGAGEATETIVGDVGDGLHALYRRGRARVNDVTRLVYVSCRFETNLLKTYLKPSKKTLKTSQTLIKTYLKPIETLFKIP